MPLYVDQDDVKCIYLETDEGKRFKVEGFLKCQVCEEFLTTVIKVIASCNRIHSLKGIEQYLNAFHLVLYGNKLESLEGIGKLLKLIYLDVSDNYISKLPDELNKLEKLETLHLTRNSISKFPQQIFNLQNLIVLELGYNSISRLPIEVGQLSSLEILNLEHNQFDSFPEAVFLLKNLVDLNISNNKLHSISTQIEKLVLLEELRMRGNNLKIIPDEIGQLFNLEYLDLGNNAIELIPQNIVHLTHLKGLYLDNNKITHFIPALVFLNQLEELNIDGNPANDISPIIIRLMNRIKNISNIYDDEESVHNHSIQKGVRTSIVNLMSTDISPVSSDIVISEILEDRILNSVVKDCLINNSKSTELQSVLNVTFGEILQFVWDRVRKSPDSVEIKKVINQVFMTCDKAICFTGRVGRLVNCLSGFYQDIVINISDNEQICNIVTSIKRKLGEDYSIAEHKRILEIEMLERGFSKEIIDTWMSYIE